MYILASSLAELHILHGTPLNYSSHIAETYDLVSIAGSRRFQTKAAGGVGEESCQASAAGGRLRCADMAEDPSGESVGPGGDGSEA